MGVLAVGAEALRGLSQPELEHSEGEEMTAIVGIEALNLTCPHCDEPYLAPNGSHMFTPDEVPEEKIKCDSCGKSARVPKTAPLKSRFYANAR